MLIKGERGWRRCIRRRIARPQFRKYGAGAGVAVVVGSGDRGGQRNDFFAGLRCREGEWIWAPKPYVSLVFESVCTHKTISLGVTK